MKCLNLDETFNLEYFNRYNPFGFLFSKEYIYRLGGRHVIYSPETERNEIPKGMKWRYVRYEPNKKPRPIDYTWEREWRLNQPFLALDPQHVKLVLPNLAWVAKFETDHYEEQHLEYEECECNRQSLIFQYQQLFDSNYARQIVESCPTPQQLPFMLTGMTESLKIEFRN